MTEQLEDQSIEDEVELLLDQAALLDAVHDGICIADGEVPEDN